MVLQRQSALKKKHDLLLSSRGRGAESDNSTIIGNAALPFSTNDEVSESPKKHLQHEAVSQLQTPVGFCNDKESGTRNVVGAQLDQKQLNPNIADKYKETSSTKHVSQGVKLTQFQQKGKKPATQSPSGKHLQRVTSSEELAILLGSEKVDALTNNLMQSSLEDDGLQYSEKKIPQGKTPTNVRKMISAFESGMAKDIRSHIKPPPTQASTIEMKDSSKTQHLDQDKSWNTKPAGFLQERMKSASLVRNLQQAPLYIGESRDQINLLNDVSPKDTMQLKELSTINILNKQTDSNARNKFKVAYNTDQEEEKNNKDFMRTSIFENVTVSGKMPEKHSDASEGSYKLCIQRDSPQKLDSGVHFDNKYYSYESPGVWIFPNEPRKICITTSGKSVMGILESQNTKRLSHQRSLDFSNIENVEKNEAYVGSGTEGSKYEKIQQIEESKTKTSDDNGDENSGGPINQNSQVKGMKDVFNILNLPERRRRLCKHQFNKPPILHLLKLKHLQAAVNNFQVSDAGSNLSALLSCLLNIFHELTP
ncbi:hypothetical protein SESBI_02078 [Sesbania bispinosa]|nr:hypothetical protein SESBI_02078 [Sesbania bispinosa]